VFAGAHYESRLGDIVPKRQLYGVDQIGVGLEIAKGYDWSRGGLCVAFSAQRFSSTTVMFQKPSNCKKALIAILKLRLS
jgi:hypothetical protein